ncbi:MAG: TonB-dependent receptor [Gemmatimonadota bacterium]
MHGHTSVVLRRIAGALTALLLVGLVQPTLVVAQQRPAPDTAGQQPDSTVHPEYQLQAITVTSTPTRASAPVSSTEVPRRLLAHTLSTGVNTWELLRQAAGLEVHQQGQGPGFASDAAIRGFSSDHSTDIALWIDGVPINEPVNGHAEGYNDWSLIFPETIDNVEVVKGPTSPYFGNFALAGAVNVRTINGLNGTRGWVSGGTHGRVEMGLLTGQDRPGASGVAGVRLERDDGWRPNSGWRLGQLYGRWVHDIAPSATVDAGANVYGSGWSSPGFLSLQQFHAADYGNVADPSDGGFKRRAQERVSVRVVPGPRMLWRSTAYATQGRWQLFLTTPPEGGLTEGTGSQTEEEDARYGFGLTSALSWLLPHFDVTVGTQERADHAHYQNWFTTSRSRDSAQVLVQAQQLSGGVFVAANADLSPVQLSLGGRYDVLDTRSNPNVGEPTHAAKGTFSPKLGALLHVFGPVSVFGNVSRGFRQTDGVIADPALPFITEWADEAGVKLRAPGTTIEIDAFRMNVSNEQTFNPITLTSTSGGASRRQGIEIDARIQPVPAVSFSVDWTFNDARYLRLITEDGDTLSGARVFNTSRYVGDASLEVHPTPGSFLCATTSAVGPYSPFDEPGVVRAGYALLNLSAGDQIGPVALELGVHNVFDRHYAELEAGGFVSPGQPRALYITVRAAAH